MSYGVSARILGSVLPLQHATSITTWKRAVARVGERLDAKAHHRLTSPPAFAAEITRNSLSKTRFIDGIFLGKFQRFSRNRNRTTINDLRERHLSRWGKTLCFYRHSWHGNQAYPVLRVRRPRWHPPLARSAQTVRKQLSAHSLKRVRSLTKRPITFRGHSHNRFALRCPNSGNFYDSLRPARDNRAPRFRSDC
jgi:hypothetical protein